MRSRRSYVILALLALALCVFSFRDVLRGPVMALVQMLRGMKTTSDRVEQFGQAVRDRLAPDFDRVGVAYPPAGVVLVGLKQERMLQVWVAGGPDGHELLKSYPILGASGTLGPKLREGDLQVPEGLYRIESLNPNSRYHLALRVDYPNEFDKRRGRLDGRDELGGDIMIHGDDRSVGCLAMGDEAAEDLFVLVAETGMQNTSVILSPVDFRASRLPADMPAVPDWTPELYESIKAELVRLGNSASTP